VAAANLPAEESARLAAALESGLTAYTYLEDAPLALPH
jgi:arginine decarboxylase